MNQAKYEQFLLEIIKEALEYGDGTVAGAASYLEGKKKPFFLSLNVEEKRLALERTRKVFTTNRDRPIWFILKCFGLKPEDLEGE
jgi:hypothetical protein